MSPTQGGVRIYIKKMMIVQKTNAVATRKVEMVFEAERKKVLRVIWREISARLHLPTPIKTADVGLLTVYLGKHAFRVREENIFSEVNVA